MILASGTQINGQSVVFIESEYHSIINEVKEFCKELEYKPKKCYRRTTEKKILSIILIEHFNLTLKVVAPLIGYANCSGVNQIYNRATRNSTIRKIAEDFINDKINVN